MSREEIEQVEKELDAVLEMVQRPVPVKNTDSREETASLQENDPLQTKRKTEKEPEMQKKIGTEKERDKRDLEETAKDQAAAAQRKDQDPGDEVTVDHTDPEEFYTEEIYDAEDPEHFRFLRPMDGLIAAFFVPVAVLIILFAQRGIFPFGEECFLRTDMYHQYAPFFSEFQYKLKQGGSLLYSWDIGMGIFPNIHNGCTEYA